MKTVRECGWCLNEFVFEPRPETQELRKRLLICDEIELVICDNCFAGIGASIVRESSFLEG